MKKTLNILALLFMGALTSTAQAVDLEEVTLEDVSTSGRSIVLSRGLLEKYEEGMYARFYIQKGPKEFPKVFLVAEGELIKSFPRKSYWILRKIEIPKELKRNASVLMATSTNLLAGRPMRVKNHHVVVPESEMNDIDSFIEKNKENVPDRLVKAGAGYEPSADVFDDEEFEKFSAEADLLVTTYEGYKNKPGNYFSEEYGDLTGQRYFVGNKQVALGDLRVKEDKVLFDSLSGEYVQKTNGMKYGLKGFYSKQERLREMPELRKDGSLDSTYAKVKEENKQADAINPRAVAKYRRDGDQWSSDMDETSLRRYFIQTGMEKEARRRELALNEVDGHEIILHYSGAMVSHGNDTDPNYQGRGYNLGVSYDLHLSRTSANLKNWSLQFLLEGGVTEYNTGVYNARSEETSYGAYLNYYFVNNPLTINSFIWLAGIGIKNGSASVFTPDLSKEYSYQLLTIPALQVMTKYRFRTGDLTEDTVNLGASLNFGVNLDMKRLSVIDRVDDNIDSKISVNDLKYTVGMSVYF